MTTKVKKLWNFKKKIIFSQIIIFFSILLGFFVSSNSLEFPEDLEQFSGTRFDLHFNYGGNDAAGMILRQGVKYLPNTPVTLSGMTIYCDKQLLGYYNNDLINSTVAIGGEDGTGLYIQCSGKNQYEIYGMVEITGGLQKIYLIAGTEYDFTGNTYISTFSGTLKITNTGGYIYDSLLGIADVTGTGTENIPLEDSEPDFFNFPDMTGLELNSGYITNSVTVSGISTGINISVNFGTTGYLVLNGTTTGTNLYVENGDNLEIFFISASTYETTKTGNILVNGESFDSFNYTTKRNPQNPDSFDFTNLTGALSTGVCTNTVTITGLLEAVTGTVSFVPISTSGYMQIGSWTGITKTGITNGTQIQICLTTPNTYNTTITGNINIGFGSDTFTLTTIPDPIPLTLTGLGPVGSVPSYSVILTATTNKPATCRYSKTISNYNSMTGYFTAGASNTHVANYTAIIGPNTINVACNDGLGRTTGGIISFSAGIPIMQRFSVSIDPPYLYSGQYANLTIQAINSFGNVMTGYTGDIFVSITGSNISLSEYYVTNVGFLTFNLSDSGVKTLLSGLQVKKGGYYTLKVEDSTNSYSGTLNFQVSSEIDLDVDSFSFGNIYGAELNTYYKSSEYTVQGLSYGTSVLVSTNRGILWKNGLPIGTTGLVQNGDKLRIEILSSQYYNTENSAQIWIRNQTTIFRINTRSLTNYNVTFQLNNGQKFYLGRIVNKLVYQYYQVGTQQWYQFIAGRYRKLDERIYYYDNYYSSNSQQMWTADKNEKVLRYLKEKTQSIISSIQSSYQSLNYNYTNKNGKTFQVRYDYKVKGFYTPNLSPKIIFSSKTGIQTYLDKK